MINRYRSHPPHNGTHYSPYSAGADSQLGAPGPVVGAFIAGPIGALIGRILAGTIEAVTNSKLATVSKVKTVPTTPVLSVSQKSKPVAGGSKKSKKPAPGAAAAGGKPVKRRRGKKS